MRSREHKDKGNYENRDKDREKWDRKLHMGGLGWEG